jgi:hypothetical protein
MADEQMRVEKVHCPVCQGSFYDSDRSHKCTQTGFCIRCSTSYLDDGVASCRCDQQGATTLKCGNGCTNIKFADKLQRDMHERECLRG